MQGYTNKSSFKRSTVSGVRRIYFSRGRNTFEGGQKKNQGADSSPKGAKKFSAPPAELDSAPGAGLTRGGAENLIIPRERGRNI